MRYPTYLTLFSLFAAVLLVSGCSGASRSFSKGEAFEAEGRYEEAMYSYADAFMKDPEGGVYRLRFLNARERAADQHFKQGNEFLSGENYAAAAAEFQAAQGLDPTQARYKQQADAALRLKDAQAAYQEGLEFEKGNKLKDANRLFKHAIELNPDNRNYQAALARVQSQRKSKLEGFELNVKSGKPITLKFKDAKLKDVFAIITQLSGINFIFDEAIKDQPVTIYLENGSFQQALDMLTSMFKLGRKAANESTVIIYPNTPEKKKQYEDMLLRTFHLNYMDAKKAVNLIRTMIQVRKIYVNEESNSIVVRDSADVVDVVDKILDANDVPDPEVVLDVEVVELSDKNAQNVGLLLSNYNVQMAGFTPDGQMLSNSLSTATTTTTGTTTTTTQAGPSNLVKAFTLKGYGGFVTVPSAQYNFGKTLAKGEVLSNPKIRVKNKEKSKFNVGTRVPITTTTLNGTISQVNVQYVDVGVKVNAEPIIQLNNEVVIKLSLEVSSILSQEKVGGADSSTTVVTIGTRNLDTVLSLKDGESSVIGGLIQNTRNDSKQKIFLLGDLPLIGPLISSNDSSKDKTELVLAITPRLVRGVTVPSSNLMAFFSGKEDDPSLVKPLASFEQEPVFEPSGTNGAGTNGVAPAPAGAQRLPSAPVPPQPTLQPQPIQPTQPTPSEMAPAPSETTPPQSAPQPPAPEQSPQPTLQPSSLEPAAPQPAAVQPASVQQQRGLLQIGTPSQVAVGQQFSLDVRVSEVRDLVRAPFAVTFDPLAVKYVSAAEGSFLKQDGKGTVFSGKPDPTGGAVMLSVMREAGSGGVSGAGSLVSLRFQAIKAGTAGFGFRNVGFTGADGSVLAILPFSTALEVR
ncbi:secretin N-terminal domain-containing protein [Geobacter sp. SVR]|uniref:secretin N-terminal domain-containing protein n=1 Tax=Geobacter sp. SVR TaxID=2495594 RepID=UPI00143EFFD3|nr:secretin N-terminal domain-containing protein [Geobacter sp. SVR]BCS53668.1 type II secretion system protein [Geobacter sp. SVR]GCF84135.1 type II secretion system protein [Geobacter sp. SVR]